MDKIKQSYQSESGKIIKQHLIDVVNMLNDIESIEGDSPEMIALETRSRQRAIVLLRELLFDIEPEEINEKDIKEKIKKYGY